MARCRDRRGPKRSHGDMSWRCAALVGCASRRSAPSLIAGSEFISARGRGQYSGRYVARAFPHFVIGRLDPAIHADTRMLDRAFWHAARQHGHRVRPGVDKKENGPEGREPRKGRRGSELKTAAVPVARPATRPGRKRVAGTTTARRAHCCNAVARATVAHPTVKQMSSFWNLYDMGP